MGCYRVFVEKKQGFHTEKESLLRDLNENLHLSLRDIRLINCYDVFNVCIEDLEVIKKSVLSEIVTDDVFVKLELPKYYLAIENLPGQYDARSDAAVQCIKLLLNNVAVQIKTSVIVLFQDEVNLQQIKKYLINPTEKREKNLFAPLSILEDIEVKTTQVYEGFIELSQTELSQWVATRRMAMSLKDLEFVQRYFRDIEKRNPTEVELAVLDTYWSDHCRHTTFETIINNVFFPDTEMGQLIKTTFSNYLETKNAMDYQSPITLMDIATRFGKKMKRNGLLSDLEQSDENNACSLYRDVTVNGIRAKYLLLYKNETHNHPTEIEPFGGASTCLGGAIRDVLSGRAYVYQAMRISGAGFPEPIEGTIPGKLPQLVISRNAALGYSSYGNQMGLSTTFVRQIYHEGYKAKHMEVGVVVGAVKSENVRREKPENNDIVILLGGRTGRDGIGGATGSSQKHDERSIETAIAEVQKGNPITERKMQRLFRKREVARLIKKCNDFGAGGIAVAIGELSPGLEIDLAKIPVKYKGLDALELAISESQERMAVVVSSFDGDKFIKYAEEENLEATVVAKVTDTNRLVMKYKDVTVVNISRDFLDTNGVRSYTDVVVNDINIDTPFLRTVPGVSLKEQFLNNLKDKNVASQKRMVELFDSTVGATTILLPFGGKYQLTEANASVQRILNQDSTTCSILSYGYNPEIASWSPFHGAVYAVIESIAKVVAVGGKFETIRFSFQEYFKRLGNDPKNWGLPFASLLGAYYAEEAFELPAIGGKDSMSGSFNDLHVPPTLISFAVNTEEEDHIISQEFKELGNFIYLFSYKKDKHHMPDIEALKDNYSYLYKAISEGKIISASAVLGGGIGEAIAKMSFGNKIGVKIKDIGDLFTPLYGAIIVESKVELTDCNAELIGVTTDKGIEISKLILSIDEAIEAYLGEKITVNPIESFNDNPKTVRILTKGIGTPKVILPVFPGTNCEYETEHAFQKAGAITESVIFRNLNQSMIIESIKRLVKSINNSQIMVLSGGFSAGDEPDGSGKFITSVLLNEYVRESIEEFLRRDGLILGICNGFQALIKSGLLPNGKIGSVTPTSPTLTRNTCNTHIAKMVRSKIVSNNSPWLMNTRVGDIIDVAISHGEGKFVGDVSQLYSNGQVATRYVDDNPNGSCGAIEGILSPCGKIFGKMGHSERMVKGLYKNYEFNHPLDLFGNGVKYFK